MILNVTYKNRVKNVTVSDELWMQSFAFYYANNYSVFDNCSIEQLELMEREGQNAILETVKISMEIKEPVLMVLNRLEWEANLF